MASTCSTHPTSPGSPRTTPRASARSTARPTPLLSNLPTAWQAFANEFGLTYRDVIGLMSFEPVADLNAETLVVFVNQLEAALRVGRFPLGRRTLPERGAPVGAVHARLQRLGVALERRDQRLQHVAAARGAVRRQREHEEHGSGGVAQSRERQAVCGAKLPISGPSSPAGAPGQAAA